MQLQPNPLLIYIFQKPLAPGQVTFYNFLYIWSMVLLCIYRRKTNREKLIIAHHRGGQGASHNPLLCFHMPYLTSLVVAVIQVCSNVGRTLGSKDKIIVIVAVVEMSLFD